MPAAQLLVFASAYLAVLVLPGPGVTALVARVLARGTRGVPAFIAGFVCGSLFWFTVAATGLAVLAATFAGVFTAVRWAGAAYMLFLAWKLWRTPARPAGLPHTDDSGADGPLRLFLAGLAINLGNPKVIVFFLALLPTVVELRAVTPAGFAALACVVVCIASTVLAAYAAAAARARRLFTSAPAMRALNRAGSAAMAGAAVAVTVR